jgi:radical S-adenosyl methionine domain-containing protein 2
MNAFSQQKLVLNYHMLELCNYVCTHCYAKFPQKKSLPFNQVYSLLFHLFSFFSKGGINPVRLNIAGGEPFLNKDLGRIIQTATSIGFEVSIITNGSLISDQFVQEYGALLSMIGVSVDSTNPDTMRTIGRASRKGDVLDLYSLNQKIQQFRSVNPNIEIKINTVVTEHNFDEDFTTFLNLVKPDRWKVLQVLPLLNQQSVISSDQFDSFCKRHQVFSDIWAVESNDDMTGSYIMIDPQGRFFDNSQKSDSYVFSDSIVEVGAKQAFQQVNFDQKKFLSRYATPA